MASGRLGAAALSAATNTTLYTCPASTFAVVSVSLCNRDSTTASNIRIAVCSATTPTTAEYLEYDASLAANGVLERTGIVLDSTNKYLVVYSANATVTAVCMGIETTVA